jgi:hypothetical protein
MNNPDPSPKTDQMAPVLVSVYDRRQHLEACIEALKKNPEAKDTPLYIVSDGWQHEGHRKAIEDVRKYIGTITGFKEVNTRIRDRNWGMANSARDAAAWVFESHDRLIRMEDDIICSCSYLKFLNEALTAYEADQQIFCICAHTHPKFHPPRDYKQDVFLWNSFSPWGYGIWKDRHVSYIKNDTLQHKQLENSHTWKMLCKVRPHGDTRKESLQGKMQGDANIRLHIFLNNLYCVFPTRNLTINSGMDGSGTNCARGWTYPKQQLHEHPIKVDTALAPNKAISKKLYRAHFSFINHGIVPALRRIGCFDPIYKAFRKLTCRQHK